MYGSVAEWRSWAAGRGLPVPADDDVAKAALTRASDYIKYRYVAFLCAGYDDTLEVIPLAAYQAALLEADKPGFFSATYTEAQTKVLTEVKGIKWTVVGNSGGLFSYQPTSTIVDAMFMPYYCGPPDPNALNPFMQTIGSRGFA